MTRSPGKHDRDLTDEAIEKLDQFEVDQGGLGSYVISVQAAQFKEPRRPPAPPAPPPAPARAVAPATYAAAPADCPKALLKNCFPATAAARDAGLEDEVVRECTKYGRVLDAECIVDGSDAGAILIS